MTVLDEIARERQRQVDVEGVDEEHDDKYRLDELSRAAGAYILSPLGWLSLPAPGRWLLPGGRKWGKPTTRGGGIMKPVAAITSDGGGVDRAGKTETYCTRLRM